MLFCVTLYSYASNKGRIRSLCEAISFADSCNSEILTQIGKHVSWWWLSVLTITPSTRNEKCYMNFNSKHYISTGEYIMVVSILMALFLVAFWWHYLCVGSVLGIIPLLWLKLSGKDQGLLPQAYLLVISLIKTFPYGDIWIIYLLQILIYLIHMTEDIWSWLTVPGINGHKTHSQLFQDYWC